MMFGINNIQELPFPQKIDIPSIKHLHPMMAYWDKDLICRFANGAYEYWFGKSPVEMINQITLPQLLGPIYEKTKIYIDAVLNGEPQVFSREILTPKGQLHKSIAIYSPDFNNEMVQGFFAHVIDVTSSTLDEIEDYIKELRASVVINVNNPYVKKIGHVLTIDLEIRKIAECLKSTLPNKFPGLNNLAANHFISVSKLKRDFKKEFSISPFIYYRNLQMDFADRFLAENKCSKKQLALMLDFSNPANFYSIYKKFKKNKLI